MQIDPHNCSEFISSNLKIASFWGPGAAPCLLGPPNYIGLGPHTSKSGAEYRGHFILAYLFRCVTLEYAVKFIVWAYHWTGIRDLRGQPAPDVFALPAGVTFSLSLAGPVRI